MQGSMLIRPAVSCRHSRTFVFGEFLVPELDSGDVDKVGMLIRAIWPDFGLRVSAKGDLDIFTETGTAEDILSSKSVQYLSEDLDFELRPSYTSFQLDGKRALSVQFASPIRWDAAQEITIMPPKFGISSRQVRRRSSSSMSSDFSDELVSAKTYFESPYSVSLGSGKFGIICPRCADKCSIEIQMSQIKVDPAPVAPTVKTYDQLVDCPKEPFASKRAGTASTVSNVSQLYSDRNKKSEAVRSLDSVGGRSEVSFSPSTTSLERRASCPSAILSLARDDLLPVHRKLLTMNSAQHIQDDHINVSVRSETEARKERIKQSLSRLSASIASRCGSDAGSESSLTSSGVSQVLQTTTKSRRNSVIIPATVREDLPVSPTKTQHVKPAGAPDESDLLSPVSSISVREEIREEENVAPSNQTGTGFSTLRINGAPRATPPATAGFAHTGKPPIGPRPATVHETGHISQLGGKAPQAFVPTPLGRELMAIFSSGTPQKVLWDTFLLKARSQIEFTDSAMKMPALVFALRGLIRHGDGEYGATRTDTIPVLFHIMTFRHSVCETSAGLEAIECSAAVLAHIAVSPVSRHSTRPTDLQPRERFEPVLFAQNGILFQQVIVVLSQQVTRWIALETPRDPPLTFTNRAVSSLLDLVVLYASPKVRTLWLASAPGAFKQSVALLVASLADRLPPQILKCVVILDSLLDHLSVDKDTTRRTAQMLHGAVKKVSQTSHAIAAEASEMINRWATVGTSSLSRKRSMSLSNLFGLSKSKPSVSVKSSVYNEYTSFIN